MSSLTAAVFVVEDDRDVRESVVEVLEDSGRNVLAAENGAIALLKLASLPRPCLILLDVMMPEMDGLEFLRRLNQREDAGEFVVLVMSANASLERAQSYPGVRGTLSKPFDVQVLLDWVARYCPAREPGP